MGARRLLIDLLHGRLLVEAVLERRGVVMSARHVLVVVGRAELDEWGCATRRSTAVEREPDVKSDVSREPDEVLAVLSDWSARPCRGRLDDGVQGLISMVFFDDM